MLAPWRKGLISSDRSLGNEASPAFTGPIAVGFVHRLERLRCNLPAIASDSNKDPTRPE